MNADLPRIDFAAVAELALSQQADLLARWFPAGVKRGKELVVGNLAGEPGESLSINTNTGHWADFAAGIAGGDLVSLYAAMKRVSQGDAARLLSAELGGDLQPSSRGDAPSPAKPKAEWKPICPVPADASPPPTSHPAHGKPSHVATYRDRDGMLLGYIFRHDIPGQRKQVPSLTFCEGPNGERKWQWKSLPKPRSLYGAELLDDEPHLPVLIVEGEPKCDAARRMLGNRMVVVAWPGGASARGLADWSLLRDRKVIVWPDNDEPGVAAAQHIVKMLTSFGAHARAIKPPSGVADKWDLGDAEREGWTGQQVYDHCGLAEASKPQPDQRRSAGLPPIRVVNGEHDVVVGQGEDALLASKLPIFRRDKTLVRPVSQKVPASGGRMTIAAGLDTITQPAMVDLLCQAVEWVKYDKRDEKWKPINPPAEVAAGVISRASLSRLPSIAGVITTPTLRPDGTILLEAGYDEQTRLYHVVDASLHMPRMPAKPTKKDAEAALACISALLDGFPFVDAPIIDQWGNQSPGLPISKAVALSAIITAVVRGALSVAPMHAFRASTAGSGKSYLVDLASLISTGRPCPVMAVAEKEDETEKRLVGLLLAGFPIISMDNVNGELGGDLLCQAIERPLVRVRGLGQSVITEIESRASLFATGNSLRVRGDMTRRTLIGSLDPAVERPELRTFKSDPAAEVLGDRGRYVAACLTIVRAYLAAGQPSKPPPLASFEEWSNWVRGALLWLGCADPALSMEGAREDDPELTELREMLGAWKSALSLNDGYKLSEVESVSLERLYDQDTNKQSDEMRHPELRDALEKVAGERGSINTKRLARWFMDREGRVVGKLRIKRKGSSGGVIKWSVEECP